MPTSARQKSSPIFALQLTNVTVYSQMWHDDRRWARCEFKSKACLISFAIAGLNGHSSDHMEDHHGHVPIPVYKLKDVVPHKKIIQPNRRIYRMSFDEPPLLTFQLEKVQTLLSESDLPPGNYESKQIGNNDRARICRFWNENGNLIMTIRIFDFHQNTVKMLIYTAGAIGDDPMCRPVVEARGRAIEAPGHPSVRPVPPQRCFQALGPSSSNMPSIACNVIGHPLRLLKIGMFYRRSAELDTLRP
ncbi:hypothetical protein PGTUg99_034280 [Puccinia graminis f. sp. tritici]|uniref:Uncharacterized protein n=1 Tax=Puccinia graminis f. sp. tritici TaxID=56615 RepID=A0A5B0P285_PUCGR|nr:hypothetical protein PGTUg99_034280 [Puccinia graminis f. sp. tritici]